MLGSQRALFDMPRDVCYLNAASYSPLPLAAQEAARASVGRKARPWTLDADFAALQHERARRAAASLINAEPDDIALVSSIAYAVATAAKVLHIPPGSRVLVLQDDHSSPVLEWVTRAEAQGFTVETVARPEDGDWTAAMLAAVDQPGAAPLALASFSSVHWSDGGRIDLDRVVSRLEAKGAASLIDATHGAGVLPFDVAVLDPDFVAFPTYKWLLGPYGCAFLYVARRHQGGLPLEQTSHGRRAVKAEAEAYLADTRHVPTARRYDMGERDHFISLEMASIGMEMMAEWGSDALIGRLSSLTARLANRLEGTGIVIPPPRVRAPHLLSLGFRGGLPQGLVEALAADQIYVAPRLGRMRVSPHVYNDEADIDRLADALRRRLG
jgi:selenocysteine lyase/cysteine desulfurase